MGPINEMIHLRDIWKKAQHWNCYVGFCLSMVRIQLVTTTKPLIIEYLGAPAGL